MSILKKINIRYQKFIEKRKKIKLVKEILENKTYFNIIYDELTDDLTSRKNVKNEIGFDYKVKGNISEEMIRDIKIDKIKEYLIGGNFIIEKVDIFKYSERKMKTSTTTDFIPFTSKSKDEILYIKDILTFSKNGIEHGFYLENNSHYVNNGFNILSDMSYSKNKNISKKMIVVYRNHLNDKYDYENNHYRCVIYPSLIIIE